MTTTIIITAIIITAIMAACTAAIVRALGQPRPIDGGALAAAEAECGALRVALLELSDQLKTIESQAEEIARDLDGGMVSDAVSDALSDDFDIDDHFDRYELKSEIEDDVKCELGDKVGEMIRDALQHEIKELIEDMAPSREELDGVVKSVLQLQRHCYPAATATTEDTNQIQDDEIKSVAQGLAAAMTAAGW